MNAAMRKRVLWAFTVLVVLTAVGVGLLRLFLPIFQFPPPTGTYAIGTLTYHWVDAERAEIFTAAPDDMRELMVQIWYPAVKSDGPRAPYIDDGNALVPMARLLGVPDPTFQHLRWVTTNAVVGAPVDERAGQSPVLIFLHGRGGYRQHNTAQVEELVSHGYIIIAIDQPYAAAGVSFPDGRLISLSPRMMQGAFGRGQMSIDDPLIPYLAQDVVFVLDQLLRLDQEAPPGVLRGRMDLEHVGVFGVSLGGIISLEACLLDARLSACLVMDAFVPGDVVREGLSQPTMWISRDAETMRREGWTEIDIDKTQTTMAAAFDALPGAGYIVRIPGIYHIEFSDARFLVLPPLGEVLGLFGTVDHERASDFVDAMVLAFFDHHLKEYPAPLLDDPGAAYSEVLYERR